MLGRESPQCSFLDAAWSVESLLKRDDFYGTLYREGGRLYSDDFFAECYTLDNGRPSVPPSRMMKLVLLQHWEGLSDRQALERMTFDLRWKAVLGMEVGEPAVAQSTLAEFRARLQLHQQMEKAFGRFLKRAVELGLIGRKEVQVIDSTAIWGRGAVKDTYNLIGSAVAKLVRVAARHRDSEVETVAKEAGLDLTAPRKEGSLKARAEINWAKKAQRRAFLNAVVEEARSLLKETSEDQAADGEVRKAAELLATVLCQDLEPVRKEQDQGGDGPDEPELELPAAPSEPQGTKAEDEVLEPGREVQIRRGVARDRTLSVHDSEMRHGRKSHRRRWDGYKGHFSVSAESEFVTGVEVTPANAGDAEAGIEMLGKAKAEGLEPEAWVGDMAYSAAELRLRARAEGTEVCAKVPPTPAPGGCFSKDEFSLDLEAGLAKCPAGETTARLRQRKGSGGIFLFDGARCATCGLREQCTRKSPEKMRSSGIGRTVGVHQHEAVLEEARREEDTDAFQARLALRPLVERKIAHLMRRGLRQARYFGTAKTRFQALATALGVNLARLGALRAGDLVGHSTPHTAPA